MCPILGRIYSLYGNFIQITHVIFLLTIIGFCVKNKVIRKMILTRTKGRGLYYIDKAKINCLVSTKSNSIKWHRQLEHASSDVNNRVLSILGKGDELI